MGSGLLLAWRSPLELVRAEFAPWKSREGLEALSNKGVAVVDLADPRTGSRLRVVGFHLAAQGTASGEADQLRQLADVVGPGVPGRVDVVAGDANAGPGYDEPRYRALLALPGFEEAPGPSIITWNPANPLVRGGVFPHEPAAWIDHVLTRGLPPGAVTLQVVSPGQSDHEALFARW